MRLNKQAIDNMYYNWWVDVTKDINPEDRVRLRCAITVLEGYLATTTVHQVSIMWRQAVTKNPGISSTNWDNRVTKAVERKMAKEAQQVKMLADNHPDLLVAIGGVITGIRSASCNTTAALVLLLLDVLNNETAKEFDKVIVGDGYHVSSKTIYYPLKEPEIFNICNEVRKILKKSKMLAKELFDAYRSKSVLISRALLIDLEPLESV